MQAGGEKAGPERPSEARCKPPRSWAWLRGRMVSTNEAHFNLREIPPLPRNILHNPAWETGLIRGGDCIQRRRIGQWMAEVRNEYVPTTKAVRGQLALPPGQSGYREERDGLTVNRRLNDLAESITMNVGGPCGEGCSPPVKRMGVGGSIVVGGRESRLHGEGSQLVGISTQNSRMLTQGNP